MAFGKPAKMALGITNLIWTVPVPCEKWNETASSDLGKWTCGSAPDLPAVNAMATDYFRKLFSIQAVFWWSVMRPIIKSWLSASLTSPARSRAFAASASSFSFAAMSSFT